MFRAHVYITGKVQGVFFRAHAKAQAEKLGLTGWVRNLPDGRVEAVFEGDPKVRLPRAAGLQPGAREERDFRAGKESVEEMVEWCRKGPPGARVEGVEISPSTGSTGSQQASSGSNEEFREFKIRR